MSHPARLTWINVPLTSKWGGGADEQPIANLVILNYGANFFLKAAQSKLKIDFFCAVHFELINIKKKLVFLTYHHLLQPL